MFLKLRSRIAPTPSGFLHAGNAFNFLLTEEIARAAGGSIMLRIDDLDAQRVRREYIADIFESLAWLGLQVDEGPAGVAALEAGYSQKYRLIAYHNMLGELVSSGRVFACICSRKELAESSDAGQYNGGCIHKKIPLATPDAAWRIQTPQQESAILFKDKIAGPQPINLWETMRHFIIRRRDGLPAYHVASLSDDAAYGIDTIVRGADLLGSTAAQLYLARLLSLRGFQEATFYHHPLLKNNDGGKLSKSAGSTSLKALRAAGYSAENIKQQFAAWSAAFL